MTLQELFDKRAKLLTEAKKILVGNTDRDGKISSRFAAQYESIETEIEDVTRQIENQIANIDYTQSQLQPMPKGILTDPQANPFDNYGVYQKAGVAGKKYHANFIQAFRDGFKSQVVNYLREGSLPDGGYLLPEEFDSELVAKLKENNVLRQISKVITTASTHKISIVASEPAAAWVAEGADIPLTKPQFASKSLGAFKLAIASKFSNELLADSYFNLEAALIEIFSRSISTAEEESMVNGQGVTEPLGIIPALSQSASSFITSNGAEIRADDCIALYYTLERPYRASAVWLASDSAVANLRRLRDASQAFLWTNSLVEGEPAQFLGRPIYTSPHLPAVSSGEVPLLFGDFQNFFVIGDRGERVIKPLHELFALSDCSAYLMIQRVDCVVTDYRAFKGLKIK